MPPSETDDFVLSGEWWLPEDEGNRLHGKLQFDSETGASLELGGILELPTEEVGRFVQEHLVLGIDTRGRAITLLNAVPIRSSIGAGTRSQTISANALLVGPAHAPPRATFASCRFSLEGLAEWANRHFRLFSSSQKEVGDASAEPGFLTVDPKTIDCELPGASLRLWVGVTGEVGLTHRAETVNAYWYYKPATPKTWKELWEGAVRPLFYLHMLLTSQPTQVRDVAVELRNELDEESQTPPPFADLHAVWSGSARGDYSKPWQWPLTLSTLAPRLSELIPSWIDISRSSGMALDLLFSVLAATREVHLETKFLMLTQAAEAFHRHSPGFTRKEFSEDELSRRLMALSAVVDEDWQGWPTNRLGFTNEPTFRTRLKELVARGGHFSAEMMPRSVINDVVDFRNRLTHGLEGLANDEEYEAVLMLADKLALLLKACVLITLGLSDGEVQEGLMRNGRSRIAAQYGT